MGLNAWRFALTYDRFMARAERDGLAARRAELLEDAHGRVLEIGGGTGANLPYYGPAVTELTITEPDPHMLRWLERRVDGSDGVRVLRAPAEDLPFDDASFDVVVSTAVLCSVDDQPRAVRELRRVLRPGGLLLFAEHVRSDDGALARRQDRLNWLSRVVSICDCNRPTLRTIEEAGFDVTSLERGTLPGAPSFVAPLIVGVATAPLAVVADTQWHAVPHAADADRDH
jgi:ubiquinone/menaquinone biosynthesis C-methylase UbiE